MACIGITVRSAERGHMNRGVALGAGLAARGHRVVFLGSPEDAELPVMRGFDYLALGEPGRGEDRGIGGMVRGARRVVRHHDRVALAADDVRGAGLDLLVADSMLTALPRLAWRLGIPLLWLHTHFPERGVTGGDALHASSRSGRRARLQRRLLRHLAVRRFHPRLLLRGLIHRSVGASRQRVLERLGLPADERRHCNAELLRAPCLVAVPEALELPGVTGERTHYGDPLVELHRPAPGGDGELVDHLAGAELPIYAYLGRQIWGSRAGRRFVTSLIAAVAAEPAWRMVLATGGPRVPDDLPSAPGIRVVRLAPQLDLLAVSRVAVVHGGAGSLIESLLHGVPLAVYPVGRDQPANAVRVAWHRLGEIGSLRRAAPASIRETLRRLAMDAEVRGRVEAMRRELRRSLVEERSVEIVEAVLEEGGTPAEAAPEAPRPMGATER